MFCTVDTELSAKIAAKAFWVGEVENELRRIGKLDYHFWYDDDLDKCMRMIEKERHTTVYAHPPTSCTTECKQRGTHL